MEDDANISTAPQKIIIKLTKDEVSKEVKDFSVKKQSITNVNKDIASIRNILDAKTRNDLIIILPSSSTGNIIGNATNKNEIIKKLRILIDPSNTSGKANHLSLRGTSLEVSMNVDAPISTTSQDIIVSISKSGGRTLTTTKTFRVKRDFTASEDILAVKKILDSKSGNDLIIILPSSSTGGTVSRNRDAITKKLRMLVDSSNTNGVANHPSLRGTTFAIIGTGGIISTTPKNIDVLIAKTGGTTLSTNKTFQVKKST